jgi:thioredoxin-like negative regulator of GroEL
MGTRPWPRPVVRLARSAFSLSFLLFAWHASTAAGNPVDNPDTRPQSYSIAGRLVSGPQRQPVAQVTLTLVGVRGPVGSQITDGDGRFQFHGLREGNYSLEIALADGRRVTLGVDVFDGPVQDLQINVDELAPRPPAPADPVLRVWALRVPAKAEKQYREGLAALAKDDLGRAIRHLKKAVDLYPEFAAAHAALGSAFLLQHEDAQAAAAFERALAIDENLPDACFGLGSLYNLQKRFAEAETLLLRAQMLRPDDWRIYYALGENYFRAGHSEKAEQSLRRAHGLHAETPRLHVLLINALVTQEKWADSLQEMEEFLRLFPDDRLAPDVRLKRDALRDHLRTYSTSAR